MVLLHGWLSGKNVKAFVQRTSKNTPDNVKEQGCEHTTPRSLSGGRGETKHFYHKYENISCLNSIQCRTLQLICSKRPRWNDAANDTHPSGSVNAAEPRRHEAFESGNPRDAYSSVSHLKGNLDSLSFAIGLREEGGQEGALERLLPMLKIQPRPAGEV